MNICERSRVYLCFALTAETKVLRIGPNELYITDIGQYNNIYGQPEIFPRYDRFYDAFHSPHAVGTVTDVGPHKEQR